MLDAKLKPPKALGKGDLHLKTYERKSQPFECFVCGQPWTTGFTEGQIRLCEGLLLTVTPGVGVRRALTSDIVAQIG